MRIPIPLGTLTRNGEAGGESDAPFAAEHEGNPSTTIGWLISGACTALLVACPVAPAEHGGTLAGLGRLVVARTTARRQQPFLAFCCLLRNASRRLRGMRVRFWGTRGSIPVCGP